MKDSGLKYVEQPYFFYSYSVSTTSP